MATPNSVQYKFAFIEHDKTNGHKNDITPLASQFCIISKKNNNKKAIQCYNDDLNLHDRHMIY